MNWIVSRSFKRIAVFVAVEELRRRALLAPFLRRFDVDVPTIS
jgi:hypothetical protein